MKKFLMGTFIGIISLVSVTFLPNYATAQSGNTFDAGGWGKQNVKDYQIGVAGNGELKGDALIQTIKTAINWILGMLSLVALALCLRGGFQMMTSGGDSKKYESGINLLKWAGIGLAVIACSWLIVSLIFWIINGSTKGGLGE